MNQKYLIAYLALLCPINYSLEDYKKIVRNACDDIKLDDSIFYYFEKEGIFIIHDNCLMLSNIYRDSVYKEFINLSKVAQSKFLYNFREAIKKHFSTSIYFDIISTYLEILDAPSFPVVEIINSLDKNIHSVLIDNRLNIESFTCISNIFTSEFVTDILKAKLIDIYYKYNQNRIVVNLYDSILGKDTLNAEILLKVSAAFFMLSNITMARKILNGIKEKCTDKDILMAVQIIEIINKYESKVTQDEIESLKEKFFNLVQTTEMAPNCANLLLKISSSILSHEESIKFMIKSNLSNHIIQVFNNLGALYLSEGAKKFSLDSKNKDYIVKAEKYLNFAKIYGEERGEYSPYLSLNLLSLRFFKEYKKKSLKKQYKPLYNNYKKLINKADSIYFKSIILCNCYILEQLTTKNFDIITEYRNTLNKTLENTSDFKIKEKIQKYLDFKPLIDKNIPVWIITETHY